MQRAEGNPLFIEEIVRSLLEQGTFVTNERLDQRLLDIKVPHSISDILASRIDRLPTAAKDLLQTLAVVGRKAPLELIARTYSGSQLQLEALLS